MLNMLQRRPVCETNTNMATSDRALLDRLKWQQPQQGSYFTLNNRCYANDSYLVVSSIDQENRTATISSYEKDKEEENKQQLNNHHTMLGSSSFQTESTSASKKRKADRFHSGKVGCTSDGTEGSTKEKKLITGDKGDTLLVVRPEVENKESNNNRKKKEASGESSKESSKALAPMQDYIHVRARRGQATDRHSLAERARREKISKRMKFLQDLVPGCNNIMGKASMLDEIINYVQSLQKQVEFLSMKLASTVNPSLEFNIDEFFSKEIDPVSSTICPPAWMPCEPVDLSYLPFNNLQQAVARGGLDMALDHPELALRRTMSAPAAVPEAFMDSCYSVNGSSVTWDTNMRSCYDMLIRQGLEFLLEDL